MDTDTHGCGALASSLDREKIGTKLYGYVLAKRYTKAGESCRSLSPAKRWPACRKSHRVLLTHPLEQKLQTKLHLPPDGLRSRQLPECFVAPLEGCAGRHRQRERRGVAEIEGFGAELELGLLGHGELLEQRKVEVARPRAAQNRAPGVAVALDQVATIIGVERRRLESLGVKILVETGVRNERGLVQHAVRAIERGKRRRVHWIAQVFREPAAQHENAVRLPAAEEQVDGAPSCQKPLAGTKG